MADEDQISIYDEIEIEDMTFDPNLQIYHHPCPCGDRFEISIDSLRDGEDIAVCPSCSLMVRVIFDVNDLVKEDKQPIPAEVKIQQQLGVNLELDYDCLLDKLRICVYKVREERMRLSWRVILINLLRSCTESSKRFSRHITIVYTD